MSFLWARGGAERENLHADGAQAARRIVPLLDRVLVKRVLPEEKTAGGVFLPESAQKKLREGIIMAVGPKAVGSVQAGDRIVLPEYGGVCVFFREMEGCIVSFSSLPLSVCVCVSLLAQRESAWRWRRRST